MSKHGIDGDSVAEGAPAKRSKTNHVGKPKRNHTPRKRHEPGTKSDAHFRSLYAVEPDFSQLGRDDAAFGALIQARSFDFNIPEHTMQLTKTLLRLDFGIDVELPDDRLCPPVPNRHNYILWLKLLLDSSSYDDPGRKLTGLDIGTGASCIYPLLGTSQRDWSFVATDIDAKNLSYAKKNIELNGLQARIQLVPRQPSSPLIPLDDEAVGSPIAFTMTNPPFYESESDLLESAAQKSRPPHSACTGAPVEMVTTGGEVAFVTRLLEESLVHRDRITWYSSMLGKQSSLEAIVPKLRECGVTNFAVAEFVQGSKTRRWAVAWSFGQMRPCADAARGLAHPEKWKKLLPAPVDAKVASFEIGGGIGVSGVVARVEGLVGGLELMEWRWDKETLCGIGRARENVWSRAWRRKKARLEKERREREDNGEPAQDARGEKEEGVKSEDSACACGFEIQLGAKATAVDVKCTWREGHDWGIFESLCGFLKRELQKKEE